jgi:hypothetical protein
VSDEPSVSKKVTGGPAVKPVKARGTPAVRPVTGAPAVRPEKAPKAAPAPLPMFARGYPREPELDALVAAFEAGNYARVREGAQRLAESAERDEVRRAARDLRKRVDPDPLMIYLLLAATALLVILAVHYWTHQNGSP